MTKTSFYALLAVLLISALPLRAEDLVLVDGRYLQVKIQQVNERGVRVSLLTTGGEIWIPWVLLREEDRDRLQLRFGLKEDEEAQIMVPGVRLTLRQGGSYLGVPVTELAKSQTIPDDGVTIWHDGTKLPFRKDVIRKVEWVEVPGLEAYSVEQLYQMKLSEAKLSDDDLEGHWDMAKVAASIGAAAHAVEHLTRVSKLDPLYRTEYVTNQLIRLEAEAKDARIEQEIRRARRKAQSHRYGDCLEILDQIVAVPDLSEHLKTKVGVTREYVLKRRWEYFKQQVRNEYYRLLDRKIEVLSRQKDLEIRDAQREVRQNLHKGILLDIATKFGLDIKTEVPKMWEEREVNSVRAASYGSGTFVVLGPAKGAQQQQQAQPQRPQQRGRGQQQQQQQQGTPLRLPKPPTRDEWWRSATSGMRASWMKAYFAENGGQLKVEGERWYECPRCGGNGWLPFAGAQGAVLKVTCPRCQGHRRDKGVAFK